MEYNLTFADVLNEIFKDKKIKCWYQGEDFMNGYFISLNNFDEINLFYFSKDKFGKQNAGYLPLTNGVLKQKYRRVYTQPDVMRNI